MAKYEIQGLKELQRDFKRLGKVPQTVVSQSARSGASVIRKQAKKNAPVGETGELSKGLVLKREKTKTNGKAVYQVVMDPKKNDTFVKTSQNGKRSYYPASQEYGFRTVNGGYIPGYRYLRRAANESKQGFERKTLDTARKALDKILAKGG